MDTMNSEYKSSMNSVSIRTALSSVIHGLCARSGVSSSSVMGLSLWNQMSDVRVRKHVTGLIVKERKQSKELIVSVDSSVFLYEFNLNSPIYLQEWNHLCGSDNPDMIVSKLTFKLGKRARQIGDNGTLRTFGSDVGRVPAELTPEERRSVDATCQGLTDEKLREHAKNAMIHVLEWKKANSSHSAP